MSATPTAALVEEAEKMAVRALDGTASREEKSALFASLATALRRAEAERDDLRATVTRLNRRAQTAEAGVRDNVEACKVAGVSMGRTLANAAADMYLRRAEKAEAERDAQHAEVLRLTGELEAARDLRRETLGVRMIDNLTTQLAEVTRQRDEAYDTQFAVMWGYICLGTNTREVQDFVEVGLPAVAQKVKALEDHIATLELLRRGGK